MSALRCAAEAAHFPGPGHDEVCSGDGWAPRGWRVQARRGRRREGGPCALPPHLNRSNHVYRPGFRTRLYVEGRKRDKKKERKNEKRKSRIQTSSSQNERKTATAGKVKGLAAPHPPPSGRSSPELEAHRLCVKPTPSTPIPSQLTLGSVYREAGGQCRPGATSREPGRGEPLLGEGNGKAGSLAVTRAVQDAGSLGGAVRSIGHHPARAVPCRG